MLWDSVASYDFELVRSWQTTSQLLWVAGLRLTLKVQTVQGPWYCKECFEVRVQKEVQKEAVKVEQARLSSAKGRKPGKGGEGRRSSIRGSETPRSWTKGSAPRSAQSGRGQTDAPSSAPRTIRKPTCQCDGRQHFSSYQQRDHKACMTNPERAKSLRASSLPDNSAARFHRPEEGDCQHVDRSSFDAAPSREKMASAEGFSTQCWHGLAV